MDISAFHFSRPMWLWAGAMIPLVWVMYRFYDDKLRPIHQLESFIDKHLLPHLLINDEGKKSFFWKIFAVWSIVWVCLTLSIAGPRWDYHEIETFSSDQSLMILLDLSKSMDAEDTKPSRLVLARRKIEDIINESRGVKIGLIAFAADPHMITPLTDDLETIRRLLPSLDTELVYLQGSRLSPALNMAANVLEAEPGINKSLLVISDGGFENASAMTIVKNLAEKGIRIHALGVGTLEGAPVQNQEGNFVKKEGNFVLSKLEKGKMQEISNVGNGRYLEAHFSDRAETKILEDFSTVAQKETGRKVRLWKEYFYLLLIPVIFVILFWFRRGYLFVVLLLFLSPTAHLGALDIREYFKNHARRGKEALEDGEYEKAEKNFKDPYRKGIAQYRAGNFAEAEALFRQSSRSDIMSHATYNLGNTLVQQQKFKDAVEAYEEVLKQWPDHQKTKDNLAIVKEMLEQQEQQNKEAKNSDNADDQDQNHEEAQKQDKGGGQDDSSQQEQVNEEGAAPQQSETTEKASQVDQVADQWLNRIDDDPKDFLKNKFYIESRQGGTKEGIDPW